MNVTCQQGIRIISDDVRKILPSVKKRVKCMQNTALSFTERSGHWGATSSDH